MSELTSAALSVGDTSDVVVAFGGPAVCTGGEGMVGGGVVVVGAGVGGAVVVGGGVVGGAGGTMVAGVVVVVVVAGTVVVVVAVPVAGTVVVVVDGGGGAVVVVVVPGGGVWAPALIVVTPTNKARAVAPPSARVRVENFTAMDLSDGSQSARPCGPARRVVFACLSAVSLVFTFWLRGAYAGRVSPKHRATELGPALRSVSAGQVGPIHCEA